MMERDLESEDEFEDEPRGRLLWAFAVIFVMAGLGVLVWMQTGRRANQQTVSVPSETAGSIYLSTESETDTGRRLARLEDYLSQYPNAKNHDTARVRRDTLRAYEQSAWAKYTRAHYDLSQSADEKAAALELYIKTWGGLRRKDDIQAIRARPVQKTDKTILAEDVELAGNSAVQFTPPKSKFTNGTDLAMVGDAAPLRVYVPPPPVATPAPPPAPMKLRVRSDRTPIFPKVAKRRKVEAVVTLALDIDARGKVARTHIIRVDATRYHKDFARAAKRAARRTRFYPMMRNGHPIPVQGYQRVYRFQLAQN